MSIEELAAIFEDPARDAGAKRFRDTFLKAVNDCGEDGYVDALEMFEGLSRALTQLAAGAGDADAASIIEYVYQRTHQLCEEGADGAAKHVIEQ